MAQPQAKAPAKGAGRSGDAPEIDLDAEKPAGRNIKQIILYALIGLLVIGLGVTVYLLLKKDQPAEAKAGESAAAAEAPAEHPSGEAVTYVVFKPFIVNFAQKGPARFLQVEFQVTARDPAVLAALELHTPAIRNDVNMLLAAQTFEVASTREGKEALREEIKKAIQHILELQKVSGSVEDVYFTSFVMQ